MSNLAELFILLYQLTSLHDVYTVCLKKRTATIYIA